MNKSEKNDYAKAFIIPQKYENIINPKAALKIGTIFNDSYKPYKAYDKKY